MKVKTSVTLSPGVLALTDRHAKEQNRSVFVDEAVEAYVSYLSRQLRDRKDEEIIDAAADRLKEEAMDALDYQAET
jgi:hypothetical protein